MKGGYVLIYKKLLDSWVMSQDSSRVAVWLRLILMADWKDDVDHERGTVRVSVRELAASCHLPSATTARILQEFVAHEMITMDAGKSGTTITLCNYDLYQGGSGEKKPATDDPKPEPKPKKKAAAFVPPTVDDVRAYVEAEGLSVDPEAFVKYYAPEWKDGNGKPVKSWKLKVRMWESHNKKPTTKKPTGSVRSALAGMITD